MSVVGDIQTCFIRTPIFQYQHSGIHFADSQFGMTHFWAVKYVSKERRRICPKKQNVKNRICQKKKFDENVKTENVDRVLTFSSSIEFWQIPLLTFSFTNSRALTNSPYLSRYVKPANMHTYIPSGGGTKRSSIFFACKGQTFLITARSSSSFLFNSSTWTKKRHEMCVDGYLHIWNDQTKRSSFNVERFTY